MNPAIVVPIVVAVLLLVPSTLKLVAYLRARRLRGRQIPQLDAALPPHLRDADPLLIYFSSPSCGMCRVMEPAVDEVGRNAHVFKVDVTRHPQVARALGIMGTPTTVIMRKGRIANVAVGAKSARQLRALLNPAVSPATPKALH